MIYSNLSWKKQVECVVKKVRRGIGILSKIRHYITRDILKSLYYTLIYPFLIYGLIAWGNTYNTTLQPIYILQKKAVRVITFCVCYLHMQMQTLCRAVKISITTSYSTSVKNFYRGLTEVFILSPFRDNVHEGQVKRNHFVVNLSWTTMNVVTQSWIIVTITIGCEKITNSRQHSEPIEFEKMSRQLRQRSREKEGNPRFANEGHFAFCLRSCWVSLWTLEREVSEWAFFIFLSL